MEVENEAATRGASCCTCFTELIHLVSRLIVTVGRCCKGCSSSYGILVRSSPGFDSAMENIEDKYKTCNSSGIKKMEDNQTDESRVRDHTW